MAIAEHKQIDLFTKAVQLHQQNHLTQARKLYEKFLKKNPRHGNALANYADVLRKLAQYPRALQMINSAIALAPTQFTHYFSKGLIAKAMADYQQAYDSFYQMFSNNAHDVQCLYHLGFCARKLGDTTGDKQYYHQAINWLTLAQNLLPNNPMIGQELTTAYYLIGDLTKAYQASEQAIAVSHGTNQCFHVLFLYQLYMKVHHWQGIERLAAQICQAIDTELSKNQLTQMDPFWLIVLPVDDAFRLKVLKNVAHKMTIAANKQKKQLQFTHTIAPSRDRLRIGYISGDIKNHPVMHLLKGIFALHDRKNFEVFIYSYGIDDKSDYRRQAEVDSDHFIDIHHDTHLDAAKKIYQDNIDILIDLSGYIDMNRVDILAFKPAPIQVGYIGFPGTSGSDFIDYFIADEVVIPPAHQQYYTEKVVYLPKCYQIRDDQEPIAEQYPDKQYYGLPEDTFVYCCFNNSFKIEPTIFNIWMNILKAVPNSVLWLLAPHSVQRSHLRHEAKKHHIDPQRLIFCQREEKAVHLARHQHANLFLDTLHICAHTTASDALWAGLPMLSCLGQQFASRVSSSILQAVGLSELIADDPVSYTEKAIYFAENPQVLTKIKEKIMTLKAEGQLFNTEKDVRALEGLYQSMWRDHTGNIAAETPMH